MATWPTSSRPPAAERAAALVKDLAFIGVLVAAVALAAAILVLAFAL
jgi:hypothetical protein